MQDESCPIHRTALCFAESDLWRLDIVLARVTLP